MIPKGYILKARKIHDSWIAHAAPCTREIWDWMLLNANHKDNGTCLRGQLITTYDEIREALSWSVGYRKQQYTRHQCEGAMKALTKAHMATTTKTTRGMIVTICNYNTYQDPKNYESHSEDHTKAHTKPSLGGHDKQECKECKNGRIPPSSHAVRLADLLESLIRERKPDFIRRGNWARDLDLMIRVDKRDPENIDAVIRWCQADPFWQSNILAAKNLREKYDQLDLKRKGKSNGPTQNTTHVPTGRAYQRDYSDDASGHEGIEVGDD